MPGSLNWRTKHARKMFTRCGLAPAGWLRDGFDLGKRRRSLERQNLQTKPSGGKLTCPKHVIFMSKCLEVLTGGRSMPGKCLRDVALGQLAGCEMGLTLESEEGEVPHLRWSQAPPLPWPRPGSADFTPQFEDQATERNAPGRYDRQTPVGKDETCGEGPWQSTQNFPAYKRQHIFFESKGRWFPPFEGNIAGLYNS